MGEKIPGMSNNHYWKEIKDQGWDTLDSWDQYIKEQISFDKNMLDMNGRSGPQESGHNLQQID